MSFCFLRPVSQLCLILGLCRSTNGETVRIDGLSVISDISRPRKIRDRRMRLDRRIVGFDDFWTNKNFGRKSGDNFLGGIARGHEIRACYFTARICTVKIRKFPILFSSRFEKFRQKLSGKCDFLFEVKKFQQKWNNFRISTVFGPMLRSPNELGYTQTLIRNLMTGKPPMLPKVVLPVIDVRDLAKCHVIALTAPKLSGTRNLLVSQTRWMREIADYCIPSNTPLPPRGYVTYNRGFCSSYICL